MAFNPFSAFQKNQKFWMAAVLLLSMTTFVFCTGVGGDMSDRILGWFRGRGKTLVEVGSYRMAYGDLIQLRTQRNAINDFMRKCSTDAVQNISEKLKEMGSKPSTGDPKKDEGRKHEMTRLTAMQDTLLERLRRPRYFGSGTKFSDLVDFVTWKAEADRLGIQLAEQDVQNMFHAEIFSFITTRQAQEAVFEVSRNFGGRGFSEATLMYALQQEYRVRIAQLADYEMQPLSYLARTGEGGEPRLTDPAVPDEQRFPMTLAQLWKVYKEKRSEFDVTLIPVPVSEFVDKVGKPRESDLQSLFDKHKKERYDPLSPTPGFEIPQRGKIEFVMADPTSPAYLAAARAKMLLEVMSPLSVVPMQSPLVQAARFATAAEAQQASLQRTYETLSQVQYRAAPYTSGDFVTPMAAWLAKRDPAAAASLVGSSAVLNIGGLPSPEALFLADPIAGYLADGALKHPAELQAGVRAEVARRTPLYATVAASGTSRNPWTVAGTFLAMDMDGFRPNTPSLPLAVVRRDLEETLERRTAETWASLVMQRLKRELENNTKPEAIERTLNKYVGPYHLVKRVTKDYVNRFDVGDSKTLAPLRESYLQYMDQINWFEGRDATPEKLLKESDFYTLFFGAEPFSATSNYQIKTWPPAITPNAIQMRQQMGMAFQKMPNIPREIFEDVNRLVKQQDPTRPSASYQLFSKAEKPILYWKTETKPAVYPDKLDPVRDRVVEAWKKLKARETEAIPLAKKIAEELQKTGGDFREAVDVEAVKARQIPIVLRNLAEWAPEPVGFRRDYFKYQLPKGVITYPREDMAADLLRLPDLKKPIDSKNKEIDDLNKALFNATQKDKNPQNKYVQVLTNRPQTVFYVAVVSRPPSPERQDFLRTVVNAPLSRHPFIDSFVAKAQDERATEFRQQLLEQMRNDLGYWSVDADNEERKSLEADVGG
jgi:hypothetical protein